MKILFAASECVPFVKTGGLADVVGALPKQIRKSGEDVRVILPLYSAIDQKWRDQMEHVVFFYINLGWRRQYVGIEKLVYDDITFYFVDNKQYFQRNYIYGLGGDEGERYTYFCRAVLEALEGDIPVIAAVKHRFDVPFLNAVRAMPKAKRYTVTPESREALYEELLPLLRQWHRAGQSF